MPFDPNNPVYTSGRINTKDKVELQYGYWEIRAKLPSGVGTWPAIWMLNSKIDSIGWPNCGEIDIMEHVGFDPHKVFLAFIIQIYMVMFMALVNKEFMNQIVLKHHFIIMQLSGEKTLLEDT